MPRLPTALVAFLSLAVLTGATPTDLSRRYNTGPGASGSKCGSHLTPESASEKEKSFVSNNNRAGADAGTFTVPVNFNIIYASTDISDGYVP